MKLHDTAHAAHASEVFGRGFTFGCCVGSYFNDPRGVASGHYAFHPSWNTIRAASGACSSRRSARTIAFVTDDPDLATPASFRGARAAVQLTSMAGYQLSEGRVRLAEDLVTSSGGGGNNGKGKGPGGGGGGDGSGGEGASRPPLSWWVYLPFVLLVYGGILGLFFFVLIRSIARAIKGFTTETNAKWAEFSTSPAVCKLKDLAAPAFEQAQRSLALCEARMLAAFGTMGLNLPVTMHHVSTNWQWTMLSMAGFATAMKTLSAPR
ncbi:hypothetical protein CYMTET_21471 [Cymbomonas tetramitiformis]|uniref:Uncharacterized protein n=1 Tax=Cymbomonas tetramitiformis TaxID=36881 RepID=A0AAE0G1Y7_9CHLO|nr:hypothetical protein CYMTET_21471 [Cymbomonas tetramitiformis]